MNKCVLYCDEMEDGDLKLFGMMSKRNSGHGRAPSPRCEVARLRGMRGGVGQSRGGGNLRDMGYGSGVAARGREGVRGSQWRDDATGSRETSGYKST
jgi:hypothetical protein